MILKADLSHLDIVVSLALKLWPDHEDNPQALKDEFAQLLANQSCAVFLYMLEDAPCGFAQCSLRSDYVEGTSTSPVGYLEGIFVIEKARGKGAAKQLLFACENWAKEKGCMEFASDCELDNDASLRFHLACGFEEMNRNIHFAKKLT